MRLNRAAISLTVTISTCASVTVFQGCSSAPPRPHPLPATSAREAEVPGIPNARIWADKAPKYAQYSLEEAPEAELRARFGGIMGREHVYLAISGGGSDGAFGAGLLKGWSESGTRPEFTLVTGISTGALIAPFAFLGPAYDDKLKEMYTAYSTSDLVIKRGLLDIVRNDAAADSSPLRALIDKYVDDAMMQAIGAQHRKGRTLLIGTTNLDAARPVMWNIGRIADSDAPGARKLIGDIMRRRRYPARSRPSSSRCRPRVSAMMKCTWMGVSPRKSSCIRSASTGAR
jgi:hypothetical protein